MGVGFLTDKHVGWYSPPPMKNTQTILKWVVTLLAVGFLTACSHMSTNDDGAPDDDFDVSALHDAVPKSEGKSKYGNPASYTALGKRYHVMARSDGFKDKGKASWYGRKFHGRKTSSGEVYNMYGMTAAHKTLPIPCYVKVKNLDNGKETVVRVNDRGPFHAGRVIDLSYAAAKKLGVYPKGTANVVIETISPTPPALLASRETPEPIPHKNPKPKRLAPTQGPVYVQMGAFQNKSAAEELAKKLRAIDAHPVRIATSKSPKKLYRVQVGPLVDKESAEELQERLASATNHAATLIEPIEMADASKT